MTSRRSEGTSASRARTSDVPAPNRARGRSRQAAWTAALERLLRLGRGELRIAALLFAYLFLVLAATTVGRNSRDGLFLARFSAAQLPLVDLAVVLGVTITTAGYMKLARSVSLRNLLVASLLAFALTSLAFWWLVQQSGAAWLLLAFYIWVGILGVLAAAQVWTLANYVLTLRQVKRLFPLVGSGSILGCVAGGAAARTLSEARGAEFLLLAMAIAFTVCTMLVPAICRHSPASQQGRSDSGTKASGGLDDAARAVLNSPYLRLVGVLIVVAAVTTTITGWQFKAIAKATLADKDHLTAFFGTYVFYANIVALAIQLLLTGPLLRRVGLGGVLSMVPLAVAAGSAGLLAVGSLTAVVFLKGSEQVLRFSLDKSATELLYLPLARAETFKVKSFLDTIVSRLGDAVGNVLILLLVGTMGLTAPKLAWLALGLVVAWVVTARSVHSQYLRHLATALREHRVNVQGVTAVLDRSTTELLASHLAQGESRRVLSALSLVETSRASTILSKVEALLSHPSPAVRARALVVLSGSPRKEPRAIVEGLLADPDMRVRSAALLYLAEAGVDPLEWLQNAGDFDDLSVRSAMVLYLARPGRAQDLDACGQLLDAMLREDGPSGRRARVEAARLLAHVPKRFGDQLAVLLKDEDLDVVRHAVRTVGRIRASRFVPDLIEALAVPTVADDAVGALARFGNRIVPRLATCLADPAASVEARRQLPKALLRIGTPAAERVLIDNVTAQDGLLRFRVVSALNQLKRRHPEPRVDPASIEQPLVAEILGHYRAYLAASGTTSERVSAAEMDRQLECIFRFLQLLLPGRDINSAYVGIQSADAVVHDKALELLDNILAPHLRKLLVPLIDSKVEREERIAIAARLCTNVV
ncbi:MAG: Npt1/Npt2 family nucleotide transporter [Bacteroidales bacterium]